MELERTVQGASGGDEPDAPNDHADCIELRPGFLSRLSFLVGAVVTLGITVLKSQLRKGRTVRVIDREGITLRNGRQLPWSRLVKISGILFVDRRGWPRGSAWQLDFEDLSVAINPFAYANGHDALQLIKRLTGRSPETG